ncbi:fumarate hydratase [Haematobacter missouriensis]|uniref:Fumarate hydratase class I n=1 Tax=Haematobacter missouriensis TaxID=366616 RepID=A0A212AQG3_9RHOB|nr:fumarate hydratase [Haematobacter missouriensis]KFI25860.1 fumarate hydratase [Haematobacter missouriensis]OWJ77082.1 fumarate hydratase [Haematobacter missouriensis]OWJ83747.1 fumarate hydratase [Haematobacter missouriensis]
MTAISERHVIDSVADALHFISYYHPQDFIRALSAAWQTEESPAARDAMTQILVNSRMAAIGHRPICQDTGVANITARIGVKARLDWDRPLQEIVDDAVRRAYLADENPLRASVVADPFGRRANTRDNAPAMLHVEMVAGDRVEFDVSAKGGGSENKTKFAVLNPSASVADWVVETVEKMGAGWCPPGILGIGIGGSVDKAMVMAKQSLNEPIDATELRARGASTAEEELRLELIDRINALGIGAQGLGGMTTVLDVKVRSFPTHAASLPVALVPNCAATRHVHFALDGSGPARLSPPDLSDWPDLDFRDAWKDARRVDLDGLTRSDIATWKPGESLLLSGHLLTGRDAAHRRIEQMMAVGQPLPVEFRDRAIYYVGPVDPVRDEVVGPAGPTTSTRMDRYSDMMLDALGVSVMIGKAERGDATVEAIARNGAAYLIAVGGAAYLVSQAIREARVVAFDDLGMEAIHEFVVRDMPVTVAVDARGDAVHRSGPLRWRRQA